jgi:hypothetical protein
MRYGQGGLHEWGPETLQHSSSSSPETETCPTGSVRGVKVVSEHRQSLLQYESQKSHHTWAEIPLRMKMWESSKQSLHVVNAVIKLPIHWFRDLLKANVGICILWYSPALTGESLQCQARSTNKILELQPSSRDSALSHPGFNAPSQSLHCLSTMLPSTYLPWHWLLSLKLGPWKLTAQIIDSLNLCIQPWWQPTNQLRFSRLQQNGLHCIF